MLEQPAGDGRLAYRIDDFCRAIGLGRTKVYALIADGTSIAAAYYCTHKPDENCNCRKPKPGLLQCAAEDFNVDLSRSIFIGDSKTDVLAAQAAGCAPILFGSATHGSPEFLEWMSELHVVSMTGKLFEATAKYLQNGVQNLRGD